MTEIEKWAKYPGEFEVSFPREKHVNTQKVRLEVRALDSDFESLFGCSQNVSVCKGKCVV